MQEGTGPYNLSFQTYFVVFCFCEAQVKNSLLTTSSGCRTAAASQRCREATAGCSCSARWRRMSKHNSPAQLNDQGFHKLILKTAGHQRHLKSQRFYKDCWMQPFHLAQSQGQHSSCTHFSLLPVPPCFQSASSPEHYGNTTKETIHWELMDTSKKKISMRKHLHLARRQEKTLGKGFPDVRKVMQVFCVRT